MDLSIERTASQKAEAERQALERQCKDLKVKNAELENLVKKGNKAVVAALETKIANLQEQLDSESAYVIYNLTGYGCDKFYSHGIVYYSFS